MPGILPMKVIKVGTSAQSRIAQACDRCRSKKIRCDGVRPTCSQCAQVGFECRTSDKLSRRAFPRGYTESLEGRVRELENENRELKDLLDEKDEKIDMLSKMQGNCSLTTEGRTSRSPSARGSKPRADGSADREKSFRVLASPLVLSATNSDSFLMGASSGYPFIESLKRRISQNGKPCEGFVSEAFLHVQGHQPPPKSSLDVMEGTPPRLFSDRCVNVYFQEWAPLFPILHKPTFLRTYGEFVADPEKVRRPATLAKLFLVFSIGAGESAETDLVAACEERWSRLLREMEEEETMDTLKCLLLALLHSTTKADYRRMQHWKALAVTIAMRLGLNRSQKGTRFNPLEAETRKKAMWALYALDCFTAATLGLPKIIKDEHIQTEYPADCDDDYLSEKGFVPTLPGESTRISSALALFRASRILGRVLEEIYPSADSYELSLDVMGSLAAQLEEWYNELPTHLRLNFKQDKPSTDVTGSRSPILALAFYHIRTLIYRPAIGSSLGRNAASAVIAAAESSKHIIQITQLLEERNMAFSFCLNKGDILTLCGMTLLYQTIDLKPDSRVLRESEKLVNQVLHMLNVGGVPGTLVLWRVAKLLINVEGVSPGEDSSMATPLKSASPSSGTAIQPASQKETSPTVNKKSSFSRKGRAILSRAAGEGALRRQQEKLRRMTMPSMPGPVAAGAHYNTVSRHPSMDLGNLPAHDGHQSNSHLDFFSLEDSFSQSSSSRTSVEQERTPAAPSYAEAEYQIEGEECRPGNRSNAWEEFLGSIESGQNNVYDAIYGGQAPGSNPWTSAGDCVEDLANFTINNDLQDISPGIAELQMKKCATAPAPQSVLSISSDEGFSSGGESLGISDLGGLEFGLGVGGAMNVKDYSYESFPAPTSVLSLDSNGDAEDSNGMGSLDLGLGRAEYERLMATCGVVGDMD